LNLGDFAMQLILRLVAILLLATNVSRGDDTTVRPRGLLDWSQMTPLPDKIGFAGMLAGVSEGELLVAGGANFPDAPPWEGGIKKFHDGVFALDQPNGNWRVVGRLPRPSAYGVCATTPHGIFCVGGNDLDQSYADCFILRLEQGKVAIQPLPDFPQPINAACGAVLGNYLYVCGGVTTVSPLESDAFDQFHRIDITAPQRGWQPLPPLPGPGRLQGVAAVQQQAFFLASGLRRKKAATGDGFELEYLRDAYRFDPNDTTGTWSRIADLPRANAAVPSPAVAIGPAHFLLFGGGADGSGIDLPMAERPTFSRDCLAYHVVTNTWSTLAETPAPRVTAPLVAWRGQYVVPSGEVRPGVRSPQVWSATVVSEKASFGVINFVALFAYLAAMVGIGGYFARRNKSTDDFFRGGQRIPWWAAGLSIFATMLSSITFMAIPAAAYTGGWTLFLSNSYLLLTPLVVFVYLPFFRELNVTSAYEYLERRFNLAVRWIASALFMLFQAGRIAIVLYLPALAMATVSNLNIDFCIVAMGVMCVVYTMAGGIEAVIWTDVVQAVILVLAAIISLTIIAMNVDGGFIGIVQTAQTDNKLFGNINWDWRTLQTTGWVILVGSMFTQMMQYTASQDVVQRYVTTKDEQAAAKSIWINAAFSLVASALFFAIGTALFVFYRQHPQDLVPTVPNDGIFPLFIVRQLPIGIAGLVVAGIFSAAQSTLSSSLNSIAAAYITDFHKKLFPQAPDTECLRLARIITAFVGLCGTCVALILARSNVQSLYETFIQVVGLFGGTLTGLFALGIFTRNANGRGAVIGAVASAVVVLAVRLVSPVSPFAYAPIGVITCMLVGYMASWLFPTTAAQSAANTKNLTIYTRDGFHHSAS
jgi:SSS family transporter